MPDKPVRVVKHGNGCAVTIPRRILRFAGFELGDLVTCEVNEQKQVIVRHATGRDVQPDRIRDVFRESTPTVKA